MRRGGLPSRSAALVSAAGGGLLAAVLLSGSAGAASRAISATTAIYPDNPAIRYTEYAHATISHTGAVFDRPGVANGNAIASPGTRVNFRTDAARVWVVVTYTFACNAAGCGRFSAERDGRLLPQTFGSDTVSGQTAYLLALQSAPLAHNFSLIWPYGTQMVFDGLQLQGGQPRLLSPASTRPAFRYVAYGDSITQGYYASGGTVDTYPDQVARKKDWSVVNMGYGGETTVPSDGTAVGLLGGNLVTVAIGTNDFGRRSPSRPLCPTTAGYWTPSGSFSPSFRCTA
jgi:hypothetical protein